CPFQPNDNGGNPFIEQMPNDGPYIFKCFHGDCSDKDWKALRIHVEPGHEKSNAGIHRVAPGPRELPRICCNGRQLRDKSADALAALQWANDPPELFVRGG